MTPAASEPPGRMFSSAVGTDSMFIVMSVLTRSRSAPQGQVFEKKKVAKEKKLFFFKMPKLTALPRDTYMIPNKSERDAGKKNLQEQPSERFLNSIVKFFGRAAGATLRVTQSIGLNEVAP